MDTTENKSWRYWEKVLDALVGKKIARIERGSGWINIVTEGENPRITCEQSFLEKKLDMEPQT
jgi:hypothetical protein